MVVVDIVVGLVMLSVVVAAVRVVGGACAVIAVIAVIAGCIGSRLAIAHIVFVGFVWKPHSSMLCSFASRAATSGSHSWLLPSFGSVSIPSSWALAPLLAGLFFGLCLQLLLDMISIEYTLATPTLSCCDRGKPPTDRTL